MLTKDVQSYLEVRRAMGFALHSEGTLLKSFATFSECAGKTNSLHGNSNRMGWIGAIYYDTSAAPRASN